MGLGGNVVRDLATLNGGQLVSRGRRESVCVRVRLQEVMMIDFCSVSLHRKYVLVLEGCIDISEKSSIFVICLFEFMID